MNAGLGLVMVVYVAKFLLDTYHLVSIGLGLDSEAVMVLLLGLVDMFMVATLLVMISQGSYQIFIRRFEFKNVKERPQWLDHVDSSILKVKIASSIAGITLIRVLKDFVNIEKIPWAMTQHRMYIHGLCLISALVLASIWRIMTPQPGIGRADRTKRGSSATQERSIADVLSGIGSIGGVRVAPEWPLSFQTVNRIAYS